MFDAVLGILGNNSVFAVAFTLWAFVVLHFGQKISQKLEELSRTLYQVHYKTSNRITSIESYLAGAKGDFKPYKDSRD